MNTFALEIWHKEPLCTFYTVRWENTEISETDKFFEKYKQEARLLRNVQELATFISVIIGNEAGAQEYFFRFENTAQALPPSGTYQVGELHIDYGNFPLRLYCIRLTDSLVILFNGGEKTSKNAQGGKTSMAFQEANRFASKILKALSEGMISIDINQNILTSFDDSDEIIL